MTVSQNKPSNNVINLEAATTPKAAVALPSKPDEWKRLAQSWVDRFNKTLSVDAKGVAALFYADGFLRDYCSFQWGIKTLRGTDEIATFLEGNDTSMKLAIDESKPLTKIPIFHESKVECLTVYLTYETKIGVGRGLVRIIQEDSGPKAYSLWTGLYDIKGHEEARGARRPIGVEHGQNIGRKNWKEIREVTMNFEREDPVVLIVGAGQGGLTVAARLRMLNIPTLIVERNPRIGDNWRNRYRSLVLHDPIWYDHMPYINFPDNWPIFTPKDKLASWFEGYAAAMELNVWLSTNINSTSFDEAKQQWTIDVTREDGTKRSLKPRHVILASGHSGEANIPHFEGQESFKGSFFGHSSKWPGASDSSGKKSVVIGCCNSGHDIAQAYYEHGADCTIVQRSSTYIISSDSCVNILLGGLYCEDGPPIDDADIIFHSLALPHLKAHHIGQTRVMAANDKPTTDALNKIGFRTDLGPQDSGFFMKYLTFGGKYYIDVGCSKLIADGKIKIKSGKEVKRIRPDSVEFEDGSIVEADEVVLATGYQNMRTTARTIFGDKVADRCTDVWGIGDGEFNNEIRTMWKRSGHPGFWFMGGNLAFARSMSKYLAYQIKAIELGLAPY